MMINMSAILIAMKKAYLMECIYSLTLQAKVEIVDEPLKILGRKGH